MNKYKVKLNPRAYKDIEDIFAYITLEKLSPENAKGQTDRIWKALKELEFLPASRQNRIEGRYANRGYKQLLIDNYIAIFRVEEEKKVVRVITVQYQGRNL